MAAYDYKAGKQRIKNILDNTLEVIESAKIPKDENFTYSNAHYGWVTGVFIDIRDSTHLFTENNKVVVSKVVRSFTSEIIEILRSDPLLREIGIRGDCVYAIYTSPTQQDTYECVDKVIYINTFIKMLNKLLRQKGFPNIEVGIGLSTAQELVVKAGRKDVGINNSVWIGDAVTKAANLSSLGNKNGHQSIVMSDLTYLNMIDNLKNGNEQQDVESWFTERYDEKYGIYYDADVIKIEFNEWISDGMPE